VLVEHCRRSNGGLYYTNADEFTECLKLLVSDGELRVAMGARGREYIREHYRWELVIGKYERTFATIRSAR
jgi:glycosyltransferase involved in cell wall biosynthesis